MRLLGGGMVSKGKRLKGYRAVGGLAGCGGWALKRVWGAEMIDEGRRRTKGREGLTDADGECKEGGTCDNVADEEGLASADEGGRLPVVLVVVGGAGETWSTVSNDRDGFV